MQDRKLAEEQPEAHPQELREGLAKLAQADSAPKIRFGTRLRNYFLTGLVIVGPVAITLYFVWFFVNAVDAWVKPFVPAIYNPDSYLPFRMPGIGLFFGIVMITMIGALAANLLGRTLISYGEQMLDRMPIVRNVYRALKQIFESVIAARKATSNSNFEKVALIEFPSKGIWSIVFVTAETTGEVQALTPPEQDLVTVFIPTAIVPPTGFVSFVPRKDVIFLKMSVEDAAKVIISAGMVMPDYQARLRDLADAAATAPVKPLKP